MPHLSLFLTFWLVLLFSSEHVLTYFTFLFEFPAKQLLFIIEEFLREEISFAFSNFSLRNFLK